MDWIELASTPKAWWSDRRKGSEGDTFGQLERCVNCECSQTKANPPLSRFSLLFDH